MVCRRASGTPVACTAVSPGRGICPSPKICHARPSWFLRAELLGDRDGDDPIQPQRTFDEFWHVGRQRHVALHRGQRFGRESFHQRHGVRVVAHGIPRVCVVDSDSSGRLSVYSSMQHGFGLREKLAFALDIPESRVNVVKPAYIGGGFGGKLEIGFIEPLAALLSLKTGKPVRAEQSRGEDFISSARHAIKVHVKSGIKKDGTFTARQIKSILDTGAHATHGPEVLTVHGMLGTFLAGIFASAGLGVLSGQRYADGMSMGSQIGVQLTGIVATVVYTAVPTYIILTIVNAITGMRASEEEEATGLDIVMHDERGYDI